MSNEKNQTNVPALPEADLERRSEAAWYQLFTQGSVVTVNEPPLPFVELAKDFFQRDSAEIVLDAGCGDGRNLIELCSAFRFVVGIDCSMNALSTCEARLSTRSPRNWLLVPGNILHGVPLAANQFDGIFCGDVLGHLVDPARALRELVRCCRPGYTIVGNLFSVGDSTREDDNLRQVAGESYLLKNAYFMRFYDHSEVESLLQAMPGGKIELLDLQSWVEPPHKGYRDYEHTHESWVFAWRKDRGSTKN